MARITDASLTRALAINLDIFPYAARRLLHSVLLGLGTVLLLSLVIGLTAGLVLYVHKYAGAPVFALGALGFALLWIPFVERRTFLDHAGHVAVITETIHTGSPPAGALFARGQALVQGRVGDPETARLALIGVANTSRRLMRHFDWFGQWLPFDVGALRKALGWLMAISGRYMSDAILSFLMVSPNPDTGAAAVDAIGHYVQNAVELTRTSLRVAFLQGVLAAVTWLWWLAVFGGLAVLVSTRVSPELLDAVAVPAEHRAVALIAAHVVWALVAGLPLAWLATWLAQQTLTRPILSTIVLIRYQQLAAQRPLDPAVRSRVAGLGDAMRELESIQWRLSR